MKSIILSACAALLLVGTTTTWATQPYDSIYQLSYEPYFVPDAWLLSNALTSRSATTFIDVGSNNGSAARYIAASTEGVSIYSIDPWRVPGSFQLFLSNVIQENSQDKITPLRMSSDEAAEGVQVVGDVIFLNGTNNHMLSQQIVQWFAHLSDNGAICGYGWNHPATCLAIAQSVDELGLALDINGSFWLVRRQ